MQVAGGAKSDGMRGARRLCVAGAVFVACFTVCANGHTAVTCKIGSDACKDGAGAHSLGDAVGAWEHVEPCDSVGDEVLFKWFGAVNERQCTDGGSVSFLCGADCSFNLWDMFVRGGNVDGDGHLEEQVAEAGEFFAGARCGDLETSSLVQVVHLSQTGEHVVFQSGSTGNMFNRDEMDVARDRADESETIDKENVKTQGDIFVCVQWLERERRQLVRWDVCWCGASRFASKGINVGAADLDGVVGVIHSKRAVLELVFADHFDKKCLGGTPCESAHPSC